MSRLALPWFLVAALLAAVLWLTADQQQLAEEAGQLEARLRASAAGAGKEQERAAAEILRLQQELAGALERVTGLGRALEERRREEAEAREQRQAERERTSAPMPEGVRLALLALRACLRADGFTGLRILGARAIEERTLLSVELLDSDPEDLESTLYLAGRMTLHLDRARGELTLRFFDGHRRRGAVTQPFPTDGEPLVLAPVTGRLWEERLPFLVAAEGVYPADAPPEPARTGIDPTVRAMWLERLNDLLAQATPDKIKVAGFRDLVERRFLEASLKRYAAGNLLKSTAAADRLWIEIDERAGIVQLVLAGGTLRSEGGVSTIADDGMRILLQRVTPRQASDAMLGMVVRR